MFNFLQRWGEPKINQIVDPFVGRGTTLAMADKYGFSEHEQECIHQDRYLNTYDTQRAVHSG